MSRGKPKKHEIALEQIEGERGKNQGIRRRIAEVLDQGMGGKSR